MSVRCDQLNRRSRLRAVSTGKRVSPTERDLLWFAKLTEHGPLPSSFLLEYCKATHSSQKRAKDRLTDLFHEDNTAHNGPYLIRPLQQFRTLDSRYNQLVYDVTKASQKALDTAGLERKAGNTSAGPWVHRLMVGCITASIEIETLNRTDVSYIPHSQILERVGTDLRYPTTITEPSGATYAKDLIPDAVFGLQYHTSKGNRFRFFMVEADRATEPATTKNFNRKSVLRNILQYRDYIENEGYKRHLDLTAPMLVLNICTDTTRTAKMLQVTAGQMPTGCSYQLFRTWDAFGRIWKPPAPNPAFLVSDWKRAVLEPMSVIS